MSLDRLTSWIQWGWNVQWVCVFVIVSSGLVFLQGGSGGCCVIVRRSMSRVLQERRDKFTGPGRIHTTQIRVTGESKFHIYLFYYYYSLFYLILYEHYLPLFIAAITIWIYLVNFYRNYNILYWELNNTKLFKIFLIYSSNIK